MALEKYGVQVVAEGATQAQAQIKAFNSAIKTGSTNIKSISVNPNLTKSLSSISKQFSDMGQSALRSVPGIGQFSSSLLGAGAASGTMAASLSAALPIIGALVIAVGGATLALKAFISLGKRSVVIEDISFAFGNMVASAGDATSVLDGLRTATRGTVSDVDLMQGSIKALQGTSETFRKELLAVVDGQTNLGLVMDVTARAARATGQSEEYIRDKFLTGLKLQSNKRLDDIGITVKQADANKRYAETYGLVATALTEQQEKAAFAADAMRQLRENMAELPINSTADALKRIGVFFDNFKDKLSVAIAPIFKPLAELAGSIFQFFEYSISFTLPILRELAEIIGSVLTEAINNAKFVFDLFFGGLGESASTVLPYVVASIQILSDVIQVVIHTVASTARSFVSTIATIGKSILKFFSVDLGNGLGASIKDLVFMAGYGAGNIIGSFAAGLLKGGTKVAKAVELITKIVADFLVGFSPPKKGPLSQIDKGGENVAKAWLDGFMGGVETSIGSVTEYVNGRLGEIGSFSREQVATGLAQLDLAIRPFAENLKIIKADLEAIAGIVDPALKIINKQREKLIKAFQTGQEGDIQKLINLDKQAEKLKEIQSLQQDQVDQAELQLAFAKSMQAQERALLEIQRDRLGNAEKTSSVSEKVAKLTEPKAPGGGGGGAGAGEEGGAGRTSGTPADILDTEAIANARKNIKDTLLGGASGFSQGLGASGFGEALAGFQGATGGAKSQINRIKGANPVDALASKFSGLAEKVKQPLQDFQDKVEETFNYLFGEEGVVTLVVNSIKTNLEAVFSGDESVIVGIQNVLTDFQDAFTNAFNDISTDVTLKANEIKSVLEGIFTGENNIFQRMLEKANEFIGATVAAFTEFASGQGETSLAGAFTNLGATISRTVFVPVRNAMQGVVDTVVGAINGIIKEYNDSVVSDVLGDIDLIGYPQIPLPSFAKGALGVNGAFIAGEQGRELVAPHGSVDVFPAAATRALMSIAAMPTYLPRGGGNYNNSQSSTSNTMNNTFNVGRAQDAALIQRQQRAFYGSR